MAGKDETNAAGGQNSERSSNELIGFVGRKLGTKAVSTAVVAILVVLLLGSVGLNLKTYFFTDSKTTRLDFENIGELATQSAYTSNISVIDKSRNLFGATIPFTQSKYVFSYETVIKAGIDFGEVEANVNELDKVIVVELPVFRILSSEVDQDSLKVYLEAESIFAPVTLADQNEAMIELIETAQQDAIANGLLEHARKNAQVLLRGFIANVFDSDKYTIEFTDRNGSVKFVMEKQ